MTAHVSPKRRLRAPGKGPQAADEHTRHVLEDMSGLVLGIEVQPGERTAEVGSPTPPRELTLHVREHPNMFGHFSGFSYSPEEQARITPSGEASIPGPPLVITRGERTHIKVVNHMRRPTAVHWHGIELESFYDGVVGWGGHSQNVTPGIEPGGHFVAKMTPPRAGTFIYHTHFDDDRQLSSGLYGPLIVVEPGERFDADKNRIFIVSQGGPDRTSLRLNGSFTPPAMRLKVRETYRFRFINITANSALLQVQLTAGGKVLSWRPVAKDGAQLPPALATMRPADQSVTVGETRDFEFTPESPGELRLSFTDHGKPAAAMLLFVQ